jgi:hypothetical protein
MMLCRGCCDELKKEWKKPHRVALPFLTHSYCRKCTLWIKKGKLWHDTRCPCCHAKTANKPRLNKLKRKYIIGRIA